MLCKAPICIIQSWFYDIKHHFYLKFTNYFIPYNGKITTPSNFTYYLWAAYGMRSTTWDWINSNIYVSNVNWLDPTAFGLVLHTALQLRFQWQPSLMFVNENITLVSIERTVISRAKIKNQSYACRGQFIQCIALLVSIYSKYCDYRLSGWGWVLSLLVSIPSSLSYSPGPRCSWITIANATVYLFNSTVSYCRWVCNTEKTRA